MPMLLTATDFDALVAAGNYFFLEGYPCTVGNHHIQLLDEVSTVKKQINRFNILLPLLCENWVILPYVVAIEGGAAVLVTQVDDLIRVARPFPHDRFAALVASVECIAEKIVNATPRDETDQAPKTGSTLRNLLQEAVTSEEVIREVLPKVTLNSDGDVSILVRRASGTAKPIALPATEAVRKPPVPIRKKSEFSAKVVGKIPVYNILVTEEGVLIEFQGKDSAEFKIGHVYSFEETAERTTFSRSLRHALCNMQLQEDLL